MHKTIRNSNRSAITGAVLAAALSLAACVDTGGSGGSLFPTGTGSPFTTGGTTATTPVATTPAGTGLSRADQQLRSALANRSIRGTDIAGQQFCTFYADDGTSVRVSPGKPAQFGTWTVGSSRVCETLGANTACSSFAFQGQTVTITSLEGSGSFPLSASVATGNTCNVAATPQPTPATPSAQVNGYSVTEVAFNNGGATLGTYRNAGGGTWVETNASGAVTFTFVEQRRDEWSVYLRDNARGVDIQIDLFTKLVQFTEPGQAQRPIYYIGSAR